MISIRKVCQNLLMISVLAGMFIFVNSCKQEKPVQPEWPKITHQTKPWARWWWMGSAVNNQDLSTVMEKYKNAGLGGLEVTPIYGVKGYEDQFIDYLSSDWMDRLEFTLKEGQQLDLGIDMANTTGWPFGGPWVRDKDASKNVKFKTFTLHQGEQLNEPVQYQQKGMVSAVRNRFEISEIKKPISDNKNLQKMALAQVRFPRSLPLISLMAYSSSGKTLNLTDRVDSNDKLNWTAPEGNWTLYAVFRGWHGKMVERAAPGGEGRVIDHFSKSSVQDYLEHFDQAFKGRDIRSLRAFFNDSYEVDDAAGQADWTPEFFDEFQKRRGYDLRQHLPALFGKAPEDQVSRVRTDYRETVSDLLLDNFTKTWDQWADGHNAKIRNQAHGSPANILDLYAASDIPETEGTDWFKIKFASSAAHVSGKPLTSSESATWLDEHFLGTLGEVKTALDRFLLNGVNHIFYHGTAYSPPDAQWPGWLFYAAVDFAPSNTFWDHFSALNHYVARVQSFLQKGQPDNDILLYFPIYDRWSKPGRGLLEHFDANARTYEGTDFLKSAQAFHNRGYTFDLISDRQIDDLRVDDDLIQAEGGNYQTIVIPEISYIPLKTMNKIIALADQGATVLIHNKLPVDVPGLANLENRQSSYKKLIGTLSFISDGDLKKARAGQGYIFIGNDWNNLMSETGIHRETMSDDHLQFVRRSYDRGHYYFICNKGEDKIDQWVPVKYSFDEAEIYNPNTDNFGEAAVRTTGDGQTEVYLQLEPGESSIVQTVEDGASLQGSDYPYYKKAGNSALLDNNWQVSFIKGGPALPDSLSVDELTSWTNFEETGVKKFSGTARYTYHLSKPEKKADAYSLDLGTVHESARVSLNGKVLGTLIQDPFTLTIPSDQLKDQNTLTIEVANLMANRIADLDRRNVDWKKFYNVNFPAHDRENVNKQGLFDASDWPPRDSGLMGPVTLTPVKAIQPGSKSED